mgnify:FL=1
MAERRDHEPSRQRTPQPSRVRVQTAHPYDVIIGDGVLGGLLENCRACSRVAVLASDRVADVADQVTGLFRGAGCTVLRLQVPDGELAKAPEVLVSCWRELAVAGFTRSDLIVGVGGGASTDLAGFLAATFLRGIAFLSIPTTVLAMVDAAVGGKTGIDLPEGKNLVGAFHEPLAVICDLSLLATLPAAEISSGLAEVVKAGLVHDQRILALLTEDPGLARQPGSGLMAELIRRAIVFKAEVVSTDLYEATSAGARLGREVLNYGHTLGHAIERWENFAIRHGEAVGLGMIFAARLSHRLAGLSAAAVDRHVELIAALGLPTSYPIAPWPQLREVIARDKKTRGTRLRLVGLRAIGLPVIIESPPEDVLADCYATLGVG